MRPGTEPGSGYVEFEIPKAKGGTRRIAAPRAPLRKVQRKILDEILAKVPVHDACHGFVAERSTVTNATPHRGSAIVIKLDLKDFFPTVHYRRVTGCSTPGLQRGGRRRARGSDDLPAQARERSRRVARRPAAGRADVAGDREPHLPTARVSDSRARGAVRGAYTRYADDLTFSFPTEPDIRLGRLLWWIDGICQQEGFTERPDKRRILRAKHQQRVTGLVVNDKVNVPRRDRRRFRAILHNCAKHGIASQARRIAATSRRTSPATRRTSTWWIPRSARPTATRSRA